MYFKRDLENKLSELLKSSLSRFILLSGARQTGKTTMLENMPTEKEKLIINLWDETEETKALKTAETLEKFTNYLAQFYDFKPDGSRILIIDESQASKFLGRFIMQMHREWKEQQVIFSGSILSNLFEENVPMPTGRVVELTMRPMNFNEFLRFQKKENYFELLHDSKGNFDEKIHDILMGLFNQFLFTGGLPGIVNAYNKKESIQIHLESLLNNIYRDADRHIDNNDDKRAHTVQFGTLMEHCMKTIGHQVAFPSTNSTILSTDSPSYRTVLPKVLEALKVWHLSYVINNETFQQTSKKGYNSKKYLFDTGIMNFLINPMIPPSLKNKNELSAKLLENNVLQEIVSHTGSLRNISTYKKNNKSRNEVDFIVRNHHGIIPIEVKLSDKPNIKPVNQLLEFMNDMKVNKGYVVYTGTPYIKKLPEEKEIHFIPPYMISDIFKH